MVIISNGFSKFHLAVAAEELFKRGRLSMMITGAYPTRSIRRILSMWLLRNSRKAGRLLARKQMIDGRLVVPLWFPESMHALRQMVRERSPLSGFMDLLNEASLKTYGLQAARHVRSAAKNGARVYHYRGGFGHESVQAAKAAGLVTICDYSIAHGALLEYVIQNKGQFPHHGKAWPVSNFWSLVLCDTEQADYVLVNSDFVKETFLHQGWNIENIKVVYWGVDDQFLSALDEGRVYRQRNDGPLKVLFAGNLELRKGAVHLIMAFQDLSDVEWHLSIAGGISNEMRKTHKSFLKDHRVEYKGLLSREELAMCMKNAEVFIFPSLAEGSARVVFEALAAGCYVITTPNSGSIVEHGIHGALVPPGDHTALASALSRAFENRDEVRLIGDRNAELVRSHYRQRDYGSKLIALYERLLQ